MAEAKPTATMPPNLTQQQQDVWNSMTPDEQAVLATYQNFLLLSATTADRGLIAAHLTLASRTGTTSGGPPA